MPDSTTETYTERIEREIKQIVRLFREHPRTTGICIAVALLFTIGYAAFTLKPKEAVRVEVGVSTDQPPEAVVRDKMLKLEQRNSAFERLNAAKVHKQLWDRYSPLYLDAKQAIQAARLKEADSLIVRANEVLDEMYSRGLRIKEDIEGKDFALYQNYRRQLTVCTELTPQGRELMQLAGKAWAAAKVAGEQGDIDGLQRGYGDAINFYQKASKYARGTC